MVLDLMITATVPMKNATHVLFQQKTYDLELIPIEACLKYRLGELRCVSIKKASYAQHTQLCLELIGIIKTGLPWVLHTIEHQEEQVDSPQIEEVDHWGGIEIRAYCTLESFRAIPDLLDKDGHQVLTGEKLYIGIWTKGIKNTVPPKAVGGPTEVPQELGDIDILPGDLSAGLPYDIKLYLGDEKFVKHYQLHHQKYMAGCQIRAGGVHSYPKIGVHAYKVQLRSDSKIQVDGKVYDNPDNFQKKKVNEKEKPQENTKPAVIFTLQHYSHTWPPIDQDKQEEEKVEGEVKQRKYHMVQGERDMLGRSDMDPDVDEWTLGRTLWTEEDVQEEEKDMEKNK